MLRLSNQGVKPTYELPRETGHLSLETDPRIAPNQKQKDIMMKNGYFAIVYDPARQTCIVVSHREKIKTFKPRLQQAFAYFSSVRLLQLDQL